MSILGRLGVFPILPTSFVSPPFPHSSSFYLPGTRPYVDRHTGRRALTVWKERVFGLCSGYVVCQSFDNGITTLHSIGHTVGIR